MLRKFALVFAAAVALGATALSSTPAAAWHHGWHGGGWGGPRFYFGGGPYAYGGGYGGGYGGCYVRRLVPTPWGPRWRTVNRCY